MRIFLDATKLLPGYLPPKLPHRENELKKLRELFSEFVGGKGMAMIRVLILGEVGVGKTAVAQTFGQEMEKKGVVCSYVNCRITTTPFQIMLETIRRFSPTFPQRGYSAEEILRDLVNHLEKRDGKLLLILDELDYLLKTQGPDLLYMITRYCEQNLGGWRVGLIGISREKNVLDKLDPPTRSTFLHNTLQFDRYTAEQLYDILCFRAQEAILPGKVSQETLRLIADIAAARGDARFALEILYRAGSLAEEKGDHRITPEHVREAKSLIYPELKRHIIDELKTQEILSFLAVARKLRSTKGAYASITEVYETYKIVCEEYGVRSLGYTMFRSHIQRLAVLGLVSMKQERGRGLTTLLSIQDAPVEFVVKELERLIEERHKEPSEELIN